MEYVRQYIAMVVIYCYLVKQNYKVLRFHVNDSSTLEMSASFFSVPPPSKPHLQVSKLNTDRRRLLEEIW